MDIQVRLVHGMDIPGWYGATASTPDAPDVYFVFVNADQPPAEQKKTMRHELFHILNGDQEHPDADLYEVEEEARRHEGDVSLDAVIADLKLWERAVHVDRTGSPYIRFTGEGEEVTAEAIKGRQASPQRAKTGRIDGYPVAAV